MAVVLVTGQLLTREVWAPQAAALAGRFDLHFADHSRDDGIAGMARRLLDDAPDQFDLVAQAMGGFVAFEVMRRAPARVRSLALLATLASADGPAQTERRQGYIRLVEAGRFAAVVEERIRLLVAPDRRQDQALLGVIRRMAEETGAETFLRQQRAIMGRIDSRPSLADIACPTLLIWGAQDGITTLAHQEEIKAAIPGARLDIIEACGHLATLEAPERVSGLLGDWLTFPD
ncbi:MAG: alpha/beta fold hydrolase [Phenylobacterium sp.]